MPRRVRGKFMHSVGLQNAVLCLRGAGLLDVHEFPTFLTGFQPVEYVGNGKRKINGYLVKIGVRLDFEGPVWLRFNSKGSSISISFDPKDEDSWMSIVKYRP